MRKGTSIEPVVFGAADAPLFGMLTRPAAGEAVDRGVLICPALGYENVIYHRQLAVLAQRLAADGRTVFRFDWPGAGDSAGDDTDPGLVEAYIETVGAAARTLRDSSDVAEVDVVGLRIGATLALVAAARAPVAADFVLWAPHATGREYVREIRAFDRLAVKRDQQPPEHEIDGEEALGFLLSSGTIAALQELDLQTLELAAGRPRRVLLAGKDGPPDQRLAAILRDRDVAVETTVLPGLREVTMGWTERPVPVEAFETIASWLEPGTPVASATPRSTSATMTVRVGDGRVEEHAFVLGGEEPVFGIVATPGDDGHDPPEDAWVVFATNRYARRIGPNRLYTTWARAWAAQGIPSMRLDLSGTGDAGGPDEETDADMYSQLVLDDALTALAFLREHYGARRFLVLGLCSGGYTGFHAALEDTDVTGVVLLNPQMLLWTRHETAVSRGDFLFGRVLRVESWRRGLRQRGALLRRTAPGAAKVALASLRWHLSRISRRLRRLPDVDPVKSWIDRSLDQISARGCSLLFVFSEGDAGLGYLERYLGADYLEQLTRRGFRLEIVDGATHTFNALWTQDVLRDLVERELGACGFALREPQRV